MTPAKQMTKFIQAESCLQARNEAPWAAVIAKCDGGYIAFENQTDYRIWKGHYNDPRILHRMA